MRSNLTGKRFRKFFVIGFAGIKNQGTLWHCKCECDQNL